MITAGCLVCQLIGLELVNRNLCLELKWLSAEICVLLSRVASPIKNTNANDFVGQGLWETKGRLKQLRLPKPTIVTYTLNITPKFMSNSDEKAGKVCCPTVQSIVHARIDRRSKTPRLDTNDFWGLGPSWNCIPEKLQDIYRFLLHHVEKEMDIFLFNTIS